MFVEPESPDLETIQFYSTTGKTLQSPSSKGTRSPGFSGLGLGDVFAPFGGSKLFGFICRILSFDVSLVVI